MNEVENRTTEKQKEIIGASLKNAMSYPQYIALVSKLAAEGSNTGPNKTEALANYTQLNDRRMRRWDKTLKLTEQQLAEVAEVDAKLTWLVITESWCGDASPSLPVMNKLSNLIPSLDLKIVLRDDNLELMDQFLTNDARSIPKLIALDTETFSVKGEWGPRPEVARKMVEETKKAHGSIPPEFKEELQRWYNKDKGNEITEELLGLLICER